MENVNYVDILFRSYSNDKCTVLTMLKHILPMGETHKFGELFYGRCFPAPKVQNKSNFKSSMWVISDEVSQNEQDLRISSRRNKGIQSTTYLKKLFM